MNLFPEISSPIGEVGQPLPSFIDALIAGRGLNGYFENGESGRSEESALHRVLKFANVSRKMMSQQRLECVGTKDLPGFLRGIQLLQKMGSQYRYVFPASAKRRNADANDIQAEEKVLAEGSFGNELFQVCI